MMCKQNKHFVFQDLVLTRFFSFSLDKEPSPKEQNKRNVQVERTYKLITENQ